jgi:hypothetical protein
VNIYNTRQGGLLQEGRWGHGSQSKVEQTGKYATTLTYKTYQKMSNEAKPAKPSWEEL